MDSKVWFGVQVDSFISRLVLLVWFYLEIGSIAIDLSISVELSIFCFNCMC